MIRFGFPSLRPAPLSADPDTRRLERRVRWAAYSGFVYAAYACWIFSPLGSSGEWSWSPMSLLNVGVIAVCAVAMWRGSLVAAWLAGAVGAWHVWNVFYLIVAVLNGTAARMRWGPGIVLSYLIVGFFGFLWLRGGIAALRLALARQRAAD